jgi:hypothetical protein
MTSTFGLPVALAAWFCPNNVRAKKNESMAHSRKDCLIPKAYQRRPTNG